jgi:hypothetical protein
MTMKRKEPALNAASSRRRHQRKGLVVIQPDSGEAEGMASELNDLAILPPPSAKGRLNDAL